MNKDTLKRANELEKLINTTRKGLENLKNFRDDNEARVEKRGLDDRFYIDKVYNLFVSECSDGSGNKAELARYQGNEELLNVIIDTLQKQLDEYIVTFEGL